MFKLLNKKKNNKGFTLVELVIVIAILAILVGLLAPQYTKYVEKSRKAADASNMDEMVKVVKVFAADPASELPAGTYAITISASANETTLTETPPSSATLTVALISPDSPAFHFLDFVVNFVDQSGTALFNSVTKPAGALSEIPVVVAFAAPIVIV